MAYIVSCSGDKCCLTRGKTQVSSLENLNGFPDLYEARLELIKKLEIKLDWDATMPAYQLYTGKVYKRVSEENWKKEKTDVIIVSALFGLIKHNEKIPDYDRIMTDKIPGTKEMISTFWRNKNIAQYIAKDFDIDLLFNKYRKAFNKNGEIIGIAPDVIWRDKYGYHKGEWLNQQLNIL